MHLRSRLWLAAAFTLTLNLREETQAQQTEAARTSDGLLAILRGLQAVDADTCLDPHTVTATVNSSLQLRAQQQLQSQLQQNECTPDATGSTVFCLGTSLDLTSYLSVQQGQCCLQCPGQSDCTTDGAGSSFKSPQAETVPYQCGIFSFGIVVSDILDGSSEKDLLGTAVSGGLLDLYLQSSGLTDATVLSVGPTQVLQVPQAPAPTAVPSTVSNSTTLHSAVANINTDTSCSVSLQEETLLCEALPGYLADMSHCVAPPQASTWHLAGGLGCSNPHWEYTPWSACSAKCGGSTTTRQVVCMANASDTSATEQSACAHISVDEPLLQQCNLSPCEVYTWYVGDWGTCSASCGGGVSTRLVQCIHSSNGTVSESSCVAPAPASNMSCNMDPCGFCQENVCSGEGTCAGEACQCHDGYSGLYCQVAANCSSGIVDAQQQCCPSGVLDNNVTCCELGSALDGAGWCCPEGTLDSCGVCNGAGKAVDVEGTCCKSAIDAAGVCCQDATVDECGVCGGLSDSCAILVQAQLQLTPAILQGNASARVAQGFATMLQTPASAIASIALANGSQRSHARHLLASATPPASPSVTLAASPASSASLAATAVAASASQAVTVVIHPPASNSSNASALAAGPLTAPTVARLLGSADLAPSQSALGFAITQVTQSHRVGICGNGICEVGERGIQSNGSQMHLQGSCPEDCPVQYSACPANDSTPCSGKGTCLSSQGVCNCFPGYEGPACESCTSGWIPSQDYCIPYAPLLYTPQLWTKHVAALIVSAPAPAPAVSPRVGLEQGPAPGPGSLLNQDNATMPGPDSQLGDSFAEIESAQAETAAPPPAPGPLNGTLANASTSSLSSPLPVSRGPAAAPSAAVILPPDLGGLAGAAAASLGATGSHVLLLSVTTAGGFCVIVLLVAAAVLCALRGRRNKRKAYVVERKPSKSQASFGGSGHGAMVQPSPHKTTPKGLRQAYAKAAGLYRGESFSDENSNPNIRSWSVGSGHPTHPWGSPLQPTPLGQKLTSNQLRGSWPFMSLSPMLQDEEEEQKESMQIRSHSVGAKSILGPRSLNVESAAGEPSGQYHPGSSIFASFQSQSDSRDSRDSWHSGQSASAWLQPTFRKDVADAEDVLLHERGVDQQAAHGTRKPLSVALPQAPTEPTADAPTPLSSMGGGASRGQTPLAGAGPSRDTALFYNGLFKSPFSQRGMQASGQSQDLGREQSFEIESSKTSSEGLRASGQLQKANQGQWPGGQRASCRATSAYSGGPAAHRPASAGSGSDLDISCLVDNTPFKINERGDFVAQEPSSVDKKGLSAQSGKDIRQFSSRLEHPTGAGPTSSRAGHFSSQSEPPGDAVHSGGPGLFGTSGQGSVHQASSTGASGSSHGTGQSSSSTGHLHVRAGQSPAALHLRESISGLLTSEQLPSQRDSNREPSATEDRAQFAGFGVNAQGHGLRPAPFQSHLERLSVPVSESPSEPVSDGLSPAARKQIRYVPAPPSPLQRASAASTAPSLLPTRQIPSPPQHQYVPMPLTNFATVSSPGASAGLQSLNGSRGALFNRSRCLTPLGSCPSVTAATPIPVAEASRHANEPPSEAELDLFPSTNADSLSSPESMSQYDSTHQREDLAASLARESCTSVQSDASSSRQEQTESGMPQQQKPTAVFSRVLQELRGQQQGQTSSQGQALGIHQGSSMFASSIQRGPLADSAVARHPADGRQPGLLQCDTYPAVKQPGSIDVSPASSGIGGAGLTTEGSTRALAVGSPLIPAPAVSANSEQSRQAVVHHAPAYIDYDVEVDCRI
ncbi:hypothetical protein WJX77_003488 [Trebouxia sp. C0004]